MESPMKLIDEVAEDITILEVHGRIDTTTGKEFADRLTALVQAGRRAILVDLKNIAYISSTGFHVLLNARRAMAEKQGKLALCGVIGELRRLFDIGDFNELFLIYETRADAIDRLKR
jgi:anti-sigma B factor antagonist